MVLLYIIRYRCVCLGHHLRTPRNTSCFQRKQWTSGYWFPSFKAGTKVIPLGTWIRMYIDGFANYVRLRRQTGQQTRVSALNLAIHVRSING